MSNYPDGLSESTPDAPWAAADESLRRCNQCQQQAIFDDLVTDGEQCQRYYIALTNIETEPDVYGSVRCEGYYYQEIEE